MIKTNKVIHKFKRLLERFYAKINGYFWLPCPICGKMFGGHETKAVLYLSYFDGVCVCPDCTEIAEKRNKKPF